MNSWTLSNNSKECDSLEHSITLVRKLVWSKIYYVFEIPRRKKNSREHLEKHKLILAENIQVRCIFNPPGKPGMNCREYFLNWVGGSSVGVFRL